MKQLSYRKEPKNAKALTQVTAWLTAAGVPVQPSAVQGCDLVVKAKNGADVQIKVGVTAEDPRPAVEHLFALAGELTHRSNGVALKAFQDLTVALGHGVLAKPIDRGVDPAKKLSFEDNFELVAMRHKEFRKVCNPSSLDLAQYQKVIAKAVGRFLYINTKICRRHLLQFEDLQTYAQIWTCNYLGLYKVANPTNNDNERKLYAHLCQRFGNFVEILLKKERSCIPDPTTVSIALKGRIYENDAATRTSQSIADNDITFEEAFNAEVYAELETEEIGVDEGFELAMDAATEAGIEEHDQLLTDNKRRRLAQAALKAEFKKLDHETLVTVLTEAVANTHICHDARKEAQKQLRLHRASCQSCAQVREDAALANAGSN